MGDAGTDDREQLLRHEIELAGSSREQADARVALADLLTGARRSLDEAAELYEQALGQQGDDTPLTSLYHAHVGRARVARLRGETEAQARHLDGAIDVSEQLGADRAVPDLLMLRSSVDIEQGDLDRARGRLVRALQLAESNGDEHQAARVHLELGRLERRCDAPQLARAHFELARPSLLERGPKRMAASVELELGMLAFAAHDHAMAEARLHSARGLWLELGNAALAARTLGRLGELARVGGRRDDARAMLDQALVEARACADTSLEAHTQCSRGDLARLTSRYPEASEAFSAALDLAAQEGLAEVHVRASIGLASVKRIGGYSVAARSLLDDAATLATVQGDQRGAVNARVALAALARLRGDGESSDRLLSGAQTLASSADYDLGLSNVAHGMAAQAVMCGDGQAAEANLRLAEVFSRDLGARHGAAHVLVTRAQLAALIGDIPAAEHCLQLADELADEVGYRLLTGQIARLRASLLLLPDEAVPSEAVGFIQQAQDVAEQIGDVVGLADARAVRAEVALRAGEVSAALAATAKAEAVHRSASAALDLAHDLALLARCEGATGSGKKALRAAREAMQLVDGTEARPRSIEVATALLSLPAGIVPAGEVRRAQTTIRDALAFMAAHLPDGADPDRFRWRFRVAYGIVDER